MGSKMERVKFTSAPEVLSCKCGRAFPTNPIGINFSSLNLKHVGDSGLFKIIGKRKILSAPRRDSNPDLKLRRLSFYPVELRSHFLFLMDVKVTNFRVDGFIRSVT